MYAATITSTSKSLDAIIKDTANKPRPRSVRCKDVQVDEFVRFCEWPHRADYTVALPKDSKSRCYSYNVCSKEAVGVLLFAHVRLYVFAYDHLIEPLKNLAVSKLEGLLHNLDPCDCYIDGALKLAAYGYSDEDERESTWDKLDHIRSVVMEAFVRISKKGYCHPFFDFLSQGGARVTDFRYEVTKQD
jgi:hypothetical protein